MVESYCFEENQRFSAEIIDISAGKGDISISNIIIPEKYRPNSSVFRAVSLEIEGVPLTKTLKNRGEVTVPKELMRVFGWETGDYVEINLLGYHVES